MRIGIDIDGVLFDWPGAANYAAVEKFGIPHPGPHVTWEHLKDRLTDAQWRWLWSDEGSDRVFGRIELRYPDAVTAVNAILKAGHHEVHFVTHRDPRRTGLLTAHFLGYYFGCHPWAGLHIVQGGTAKRSLGRFDVFVDDKPETVYDFLWNTDAHVFSPVRPWNAEELGGVTDSGFTHYSDPQEIVDWVSR